MKIGCLNLENNVCLAPMAGVTDLPFRTIVRKHARVLGFTEMVSAEGLVRGMARSLRYLDSSIHDRPLGVQIFGADASKLAEAARIVTERGADLIDINMGCPVKKVVRSGAGAALMKTPALAARILREVRRATPLPVTVKIRSGWERSCGTAREIAMIAEDCGIDAVILHARTVEQGFGGQADWRVIGDLKRLLRIPVIGNGDIRTPEDAVRMFAETSCDGVMIGRGSLGNPWIFQGILAVLSGSAYQRPLMSERQSTLLDHLEMALQYWQWEEQGVRNFRKHLLWYTKGLRGGGQFRQQLGGMNKERQVRSAIACFFKYLQDYPLDLNEPCRDQNSA